MQPTGRRLPTPEQDSVQISRLGESLVVSTKKLVSFVFVFYVGDIILEVGLSLFWPTSLGPWP